MTSLAKLGPLGVGEGREPGRSDWLANRSSPLVNPCYARGGGSQAGELRPANPGLGYKGLDHSPREAPMPTWRDERGDVSVVRPATQGSRGDAQQTTRFAETEPG